MTETPPPVPIEAERKSAFEATSIVWLIPLAALAVALWVAWQTYADRGPLISISFEDASGVVAGDTKLRYRNVAVGDVESVGFSDTLDSVQLEVRLDKKVAPFVDSDAKFWVVQPEVSTRGVSGLDTVLSGVYIEGVWDTEPGGVHYEFTGETDAPLAGVDQSGLQFVLRSRDNTTLSGSSPIVFRGIEVGQLGPARLTADGAAAEADAIIYAPYDNLVTTSTRFWDTSGFSFSIGTNGAEIDFSSLASLIAGGVTFDTVVSGGGRVAPGSVFEIFADEEAARASLFNNDEGAPVRVTAVFEENLSGLETGAPVEFGGVRVGTVTNLTGIVDSDMFGDERIRLRTTLSLIVSRLGFEAADEADALEFIATQVETGLRARLATASILTGGLKVELVELVDAPLEVLDRDAQPFPRLPVTEGAITDSELTAESFLTRVNALPVEDLMEAAIAFLNNGSVLLADDGLRAVPSEVAGLLSEVRDVVGSEEVQGLPAQAAAIAAELQLASAELTGLLTALREEDAVARLLTAVDATSGAAAAFTATTTSLEPLLEQVVALAETANGLPLDALLADARGLVASANALIAADSTQALPAALQATIGEVETLLAALNEGEATARLLAAIDAATAAANGVQSSVAGLPDLLAELEALAATARALPLDQTLTQATGTLASVEAFLAEEATVALPAALGDALAEVEVLLAGLNETDISARLLAAVDAAGAAAAEIETAAGGVPALLTRLSALSEKAEALPLEALVTELTGVLESADSVLATDGAQALPGALSGALEELDAVLSELRAGGTVENVNATLSAAEAAATSIATATADLPALIDRLNGVLAQAAATLGAYDNRSEVNADARRAMREITKAAEAVQSLARALERRPNSLLTGR